MENRMIFVRGSIALVAHCCGDYKGGRTGALTPKHGIRYTLRLSLWRRLRLSLTPHSRRDRAIRWTIGDALECVCDSRQLQCQLVRSVRPLQHHNLLPAEVKSGPKHQPNHDGNTRHKHVVTCDSDASTRDSNHVIREQRFLPGVNRSPACMLMGNRIGSATSSGFPRAGVAMSAALQRGVLRATITAKVRTASNEMC